MMPPSSESNCILWWIGCITRHKWSYNDFIRELAFYFLLLIFAIILRCFASPNSSFHFPSHNHSPPLSTDLPLSSSFFFQLFLLIPFSSLTFPFSSFVLPSLHSPSIFSSTPLPFFLFSFPISNSPSSSAFCPDRQNCAFKVWKGVTQVEKKTLTQIHGGSIASDPPSCGYEATCL